MWMIIKHASYNYFLLYLAFEISIDYNNRFVAPRSNDSKANIPILVIDKSMCYSNKSQLFRLYSILLENFKLTNVPIWTVCTLVRLFIRH